MMLNTIYFYFLSLLLIKVLVTKYFSTHLSF
ncbi:CLUMA_CG005734, isoform A [Clunio marinus]|uniref:CLUMA_CG005734, isoform A n=1 Tax=Clunio marinus TaxID=568069 RepID=A0A1J1I0B0_9DIPT|nr:CLUMA_CG005734, isoform A [Clunio marinus]